jgi:hypothetical protein
MECDDLRLFQQWIAHWHDLAEFEVVPVVLGKDTAEAIMPLLESPQAVLDLKTGSL